MILFLFFSFAFPEPEISPETSQVSGRKPFVVKVLDVPQRHYDSRKSQDCRFSNHDNNNHNYTRRTAHKPQYSNRDNKDYNNAGKKYGMRDDYNQYQEQPRRSYDSGYNRRPFDRSMHQNNSYNYNRGPPPIHRDGRGNHRPSNSPAEFRHEKSSESSTRSKSNDSDGRLTDQTSQSSIQSSVSKSF